MYLPMMGSRSCLILAEICVGSVMIANCSAFAHPQFRSRLASGAITVTDGPFSESKEVIGGIAYPANKYGKVIYAAG